MRNSTGTDFQPGTYGTIKESNRPCGRAPPSPLRINTILSFLGSQQCYVLGLIKEQLTCSAFHVDVCENDFIGYRQSFTFLIAFLRSRADHGGSHIPILHVLRIPVSSIVYNIEGTAKNNCIRKDVASTYFSLTTRLLGCFDEETDDAAIKTKMRALG